MFKKHTSNLAFFTLVLAAAGLAQAQVEIDTNTFGGLRARAIGPAVMSGRIAAIDAVGEDPLKIFVGAASGGVWRSKDGGITWRAVFDESIFGTMKHIDSRTFICRQILRGEWAEGQDGQPPCSIRGSA